MYDYSDINSFLQTQTGKVNPKDKDSDLIFTLYFDIPGCHSDTWKLWAWPFWRRVRKTAWLWKKDFDGKNEFCRSNGPGYNKKRWLGGFSTAIWSAGEQAMFQAMS